MGSSHLLIIFAGAFLLVVGITPLMRRTALRFGLIDHPAPNKIHRVPVPLLGGVAIYAAVVSALLLYPERRELVELASILLGATLVSVSGLWDDSQGLRASMKLFVQIVATLILVAAGVRVQLPLPDAVNLALTFLWILGVTNAFNLLDNVDGLCGGLGAIAAAFFLLLAVLNGQYLVGAFAAALLGACLGFLIYNVNPARIFMGDVGSLFIGFSMAALGIKLRFVSNVPWVTWMVPVLVLGVAVFDTILVVLSRLRRRVNPFTSAGTDHTSHRLLSRGWSWREAVLLLYLTGCALGGIAIFVSVASSRAAYSVAGIVVLVAVAALVWLEK